MSNPDARPVSRPMNLADGRLAIVTGDPNRWKDSLAGTPSSSACVTALLRDFGKPTVHLPEALSLVDLEELIRSTGLDVTGEPAESLEDLVQQVDLGHTVLIVVNAGVFWRLASALEHSEPNHLALVSATAQDSKSGDLLGAFVGDPSFPETRFIPVEDLERGWLKPGGGMLAVWTNKVEEILSNEL